MTKLVIIELKCAGTKRREEVVHGELNYGEVRAQINDKLWTAG